MSDPIAAVVSCLQKNDLIGATRLCEELVAREPENADFWHVFGVVEHKKGENGKAIEHIRKAISLRPGDGQFHYNRGVISMELGEKEEAKQAYEETLRLEPGHTAAANNLGNLYLVEGAFGATLRAYQMWLDAEPGSGEAMRVVGLAKKMIGDVEGAIQMYLGATEAAPGDSVMGSDFVFCHQYKVGINAEKLGKFHRAWNAQYGKGTLTEFPKRDAGKQIRLGFVSPDLGHHPVGMFLAPLLDRLDRARFHVTCYSERENIDSMTERIRGKSDQWRNIKGASDDALRERIDQDGIDILFDLAGHTDNNRMALFARRAAPLQMTWGGYVGTTGLAAMDVILCDRIHVPAEVEAHYTERPIRLANDYIGYEPPAYAPKVGDVPSAAEGRVTFGCFNNPTKVNALVAEVWSEVLEKVPGSGLLLKYKGFDDAAVQERIFGIFAPHGIGKDRIEMRGSTNHLIHLEAYGEVDVVLDPFPYSGGLTTCEALWMGVPTVTWPGDTFASRHSLAHLTNAGYTGTIASSREDYVRIAVELALDEGRRMALRKGMRAQVAGSALCDLDTHAASFSKEVERVWVEWCSGGDRRFPFREFSVEAGKIRVVEIGASPVDGSPVFECWRRTGDMELVSFEPNPSEHAKLSDPDAVYLSDAVGDGKEATLNVCEAPGMTSLLEPDLDVLGHFHGFAEWAKVVKRIPMKTRRLDDVDEIEGVDLLVMDVQGSELPILRHGRRKLQKALVVQAEVNFVPFYKDQPLFAEIDREMRDAGFFLHRFTPIVSRTFKPFTVNSDIYAGFSQQLWADAIYVRKFTEFGGMAKGDLLRLAKILHDVYGSYDLAGLALSHVGEDVRAAYFERLGIK